MFKMKLKSVQKSHMKQLVNEKACELENVSKHDQLCTQNQKHHHQSFYHKSNVQYKYKKNRTW